VTIRERRYVPWDGRWTRPWVRWLVLPRYGLRAAFRSRLFASLYTMGFAAPLLGLLVIYVDARADQLGQIGAVLAGFEIDRRTFRLFLEVQSRIAFVVGLIVGPAMVADELAAGALPLVLARPIGRWGYIAGKLATPALLLSGLTWIPGLALVLFKTSLSGSAWLLANLRIPAALFAASWCWIALICLLALASTAVAGSKSWGRGLFFALFVAPAAAGRAAATIAGLDGALAVDLSATVGTLYQWLFGDPVTTGLSPAVAVLAVLAWCGAAALVIDRRIRPVRIVR